MHHVKEILTSIANQIEQAQFDDTSIDGLAFRIDNIFHIVKRYAEVYTIPLEVLDFMGKAAEIFARANKDAWYGYVPEKEKRDYKGRPAFNITKEQLELYIAYGFSVSKISRMIHVSKSTIKRRMKHYGFSISQQYCDLSDTELDKLVEDILKDFPNCGYRRMSGILESRKVRVQESRVRSSMRNVDPEGVLLRSMQVKLIYRRKYSVAGPLSLWHLDGNHKLIRYTSYCKICPVGPVGRSPSELTNLTTKRPVSYFIIWSHVAMSKSLLWVFSCSTKQAIRNISAISKGCPNSSNILTTKEQFHSKFVLSIFSSLS